MPPIALRYLRASFAFLIYGVLLGLHLSAALHLGRGGYGPGYVAAHTHVGMIGFLLMGIAGIALWKLPEPAPGASARVPEVCWWLLVLSVLARSTLEVWTSYASWSWLRTGVFAVSCAEAVAIFVLGRHLLARARSAMTARSDPHKFESRE
jgi:hypothetical protein